MNFFSLSDIKNAFIELEHSKVLEDLKTLHPYLITVIPEPVLLEISLAVGAVDFDEFIAAVHEADSEGITWFDHLNVNDVPEELLNATNEQGELIKALFEMVDLYEVLENNNYSGGDIDGIAFIAEDYFTSYIRESENETNSIPDHLQEYINWEDFAHRVRNADYGGVKIPVSHVFKLNNPEFYYRK